MTCFQLPSLQAGLLLEQCAREGSWDVVEAVLIEEDECMVRYLFVRGASLANTLQRMLGGKLREDSANSIENSTTPIDNRNAPGSKEPT